MSDKVHIFFRNDPEIHKIRNLAEELSLTLERERWGSLPIDEADRATDYLCICDIRTNKLKHVQKLVGDLLEKHYLGRFAHWAADQGED